METIEAEPLRSAVAPVGVPVRRIRARGAGYVSLGRSAAAHVRLILAAALAGLLIGGAYGAVRHPVYSAEARLMVGKSTTLSNEAATAGLPAAVAQMASDYSRLANTQAVTSEVEQKLHRASLGGTLSASPIPESPVMRVDATGPTQADAIALANAGAQAIIDQVNAINQTDQADLNALVTAYQNLEYKLYQDQAALAQLQAQVPKGATPSSALQAQLSNAEAAVATDQLQATAVQNQYNNQYSPVQSDAQVINLVSHAAANGSDKTKYLEIGVVGGLLGGVILGVALAAFVDLRRPSPKLPVARPGRN